MAFKDLAREALADEKGGVKFYSRMLKSAKAPDSRAKVSEARADERKHKGYMEVLSKRSK